MKQQAVLAMGLLIGTLSPAGQRLEITANVPADFTLPASTAAVRQIVCRGTDGVWTPLKFQQDGKGLRFRVLPAQTGGRATLLVDPPEGVDLNDSRPPQLLALHIDGKSMPPKADWQLPAGAAPPKRLAWDVSDAENGIDADSFRATLNGQTLPTDRLTLGTPSPRKLLVRVDLSGLPLGLYHLQASVADRSPDRNRLLLQARFECFDPTNLLRGSPGVAKLTVDSHYDSYPEVSPLTDGVRRLPGKSAGNDVTWASAETETEHWVEIALRKPARLQEITLCWARQESASRVVEVQVPEGKGWRAVHRADDLPTEQCVKLSFPVVTASRFRILQPKGGGSPGRPNLLWLTEIEAR